MVHSSPPDATDVAAANAGYDKDGEVGDEAEGKEKEYEPTEIMATEQRRVRINHGGCTDQTARSRLFACRTIN